MDQVWDLLIFFVIFFIFGKMIDMFVSCLRHLYEDMGKDGIAKPVQFGNFEIIHPSKTSFKDGPQYISKLLGMIELGQVVVFPYNPR